MRLSKKRNCSGLGAAGVGHGAGGLGRALRPLLAAEQRFEVVDRYVGVHVESHGGAVARLIGASACDGSVLGRVVDLHGRRERDDLVVGRDRRARERHGHGPVHPDAGRVRRSPGRRRGDGDRRRRVCDVDPVEG